MLVIQLHGVNSDVYQNKMVMLSFHHKIEIEVF